MYYARALERSGAHGKGEGKLAEAAKVAYDRESNTIEIENYGLEPVRLTQVEVIGPKKKKVTSIRSRR